MALLMPIKRDLDAEDDDDIVIVSGPTWNIFSANLVENLFQHCVLIGERHLDRVMSDFNGAILAALQKTMSRPMLRDKLRHHLFVFHLYHKEALASFVNMSNYYEVMEELMVKYVTIELEIIRTIEKRDYKTYTDKMRAAGQQIIKVMMVLLDAKEEHCMHVLLKVNCNKPNGQVKDTLAIIYNHFLRILPLPRKVTEEVFCRHYLTMQKWKDIHLNEEKTRMDEYIMNRFNMSGAAIEASKVLRTILIPKYNIYNMDAKIYALHGKDMGIQCYFEHMKKLKARRKIEPIVFDMPLDEVTIIPETPTVSFESLDKSPKTNDFTELCDSIMKSYENKDSNDKTEYFMDEDPYINSTATPQFIVNVDDNDDSDIEIIDVQIVDTLPRTSRAETPNIIEPFVNLESDSEKSQDAIVNQEDVSSTNAKEITSTNQTESTSTETTSSTENAVATTSANTNNAIRQEIVSTSVNNQEQDSSFEETFTRGEIVNIVEIKSQLQLQDVVSSTFEEPEVTSCNEVAETVIEEQQSQIIEEIPAVLEAEVVEAVIETTEEPLIEEGSEGASIIDQTYGLSEYLILNRKSKESMQEQEAAVIGTHFPTVGSYEETPDTPEYSNANEEELYSNEELNENVYNVPEQDEYMLEIAESDITPPLETNTSTPIQHELNVIEEIEVNTEVVDMDIEYNFPMEANHAEILEDTSINHKVMASVNMNVPIIKQRPTKTTNAAFSKTDKQKSNSDKVLYKEKIVDMEQIEHDNKMDEEIFNSSSKDMFETPAIVRNGHISIDPKIINIGVKRTQLPKLPSRPLRTDYIDIKALQTKQSTELPSVLKQKNYDEKSTKVKTRGKKIQFFPYVEKVKTGFRDLLPPPPKRPCLFKESEITHISDLNASARYILEHKKSFVHLVKATPEQLRRNYEKELRDEARNYARNTTKSCLFAKVTKAEKMDDETGMTVSIVILGSIEPSEGKEFCLEYLDPEDVTLNADFGVYSHVISVDNSGFLIAIPKSDGITNIYTLRNESTPQCNALNLTVSPDIEEDTSSEFSNSPIYFSDAERIENMLLSDEMQDSQTPFTNDLLSNASNFYNGSGSLEMAREQNMVALNNKCIPLKKRMLANRKQDDYDRMQNEYDRNQDDYSQKQDDYNRKQNDYDRIQEDYSRNQDDYNQNQEEYNRKQIDYDRKQEDYDRKQRLDKVEVEMASIHQEKEVNTKPKLLMSIAHVYVERVKTPGEKKVLPPLGPNSFTTSDGNMQIPETLPKNHVFNSTNRSYQMPLMIGNNNQMPGGYFNEMSLNQQTPKHPNMYEMSMYQGMMISDMPQEPYRQSDMQQNSYRQQSDMPQESYRPQQNISQEPYTQQQEMSQESYRRQPDIPQEPYSQQDIPQEPYRQPDYMFYPCQENPPMASYSIPAPHTMQESIATTAAPVSIIYTETKTQVPNNSVKTPAAKNAGRGKRGQTTRKRGNRSKFKY